METNESLAAQHERRLAVEAVIFVPVVTALVRDGGTIAAKKVLAVPIELVLFWH